MTEIGDLLSLATAESWRTTPHGDHVHVDRSRRSLCLGVDAAGNLRTRTTGWAEHLAALSELQVVLTSPDDPGCACGNCSTAPARSVVEG